MIKQLDVYSPNLDSEPYTLDPAGMADTDIFQITDIQGLGPVKADIQTSKTAGVRGSAYRGFDVGERNIVMTLRPNPNWTNWTHEDIRYYLNIAFTSGSPVRLVFTRDPQPSAEISGYVESCEQNLFTKDLEYQISIICPRPDFIGLEDIVITGGSPTGVPMTITYDGTVNTGFKIDFRKGIGNILYSGDVLMVLASPGESVFTVKDVYITRNTDFLRINSIAGQKGASIQHPSPTPDENILQQVTTSSTWLELTPGDNIFKFFAGSGTNWTMTYRNRYGGL